MKHSEHSPKKRGVYHTPVIRGASAGFGNVRHEWPLEVEWVRVWQQSKFSKVSIFIHVS